MRTFAYDSPEFQSQLRHNAHAGGEVSFLRSIAEPGMIALDVGANRGVTTVALAKAVGEDGQVWAFEPVPEHFAALKANLSWNGAANVEAHQLLLADQPGEVQFYKHGEGSGITPAEGAERLTVLATTIDEFLAEHHVGRVDLINSDCEGSELFMLRGGENALMAHSPKVFCEVHHGYLAQMNQSVADVVGYLQQLGFEVSPVSVEHLAREVGFDECSHIYATR